MVVRGEDRVFPARQRRAHLLETGLVFLAPERAVEEDKGPAHAGVFGQGLFRPVNLFRAEAAERPVFGVEGEEEDVLVNETGPWAAVPLLPGVKQQRVADVVVARHVVERHVQPVHKAVELLPLGGPELWVRRVAIDQVAGRHHEFRLEQLELGQRTLEHAGSVAARAIGQDGEAEDARGVVDWLVADGLGICGGSNRDGEAEGREPGRAFMIHD